jgi:hypothetical protein
MIDLKKAHFKVTSITDLKAVKVGDILPTSDFSLLAEDSRFIQYEHNDGIQEEHKLEVRSGIFTIINESPSRLGLKTTSFTSDPILKEYDVASLVSSRIDSFFNKLDVYKKYDIKFPKRGILLFGKPGVGKSASITEVANRYAANGDTLIVLWSTSDYDASDVKSLIQSMVYVGVTKMILIAEDIGGGEYVGGKMAIKASLLSLLDNVEETFKIPTMVVATTNYPENLLEALTNRPGRFDDKIEVKPPSGDHRAKLLQFFAQGQIDEETLNLIKHKKYDGLSVAHLKEIHIRSELYDLTLKQSMNQVLEQSSNAGKDFQKGGNRVGIGRPDDEDDDDDC